MSASAFLFPGQGAQYVGMGRDLAERYSVCGELFERAGAVLGYDLAAVCFEGPEEELLRADRAQVAIFVVSAACLEALGEEGVQVSAVAAAGLSSGEWAGLYAAGAIDFEDCVRVLDARGRFMQEACRAHRGGMLSVIGLDAAKIEEVAARAGVQVANFNSPEQTVLSGPLEGIEAAEGLAREAGARRVIRLNVAGAYHSTLMKEAADRLGEFLKDVEIRAPRIPVACNVTGVPHEDDPASIRSRMVEQVYSPVRWVDCVRWMISAGAGEFLECGPGRVLAGLLKRIDKRATVHNIQDRSSLEKFLQAHGAGQGGESR